MHEVVYFIFCADCIQYTFYNIIIAQFLPIIYYCENRQGVLLIKFLTKLTLVSLNDFLFQKHFDSKRQCNCNFSKRKKERKTAPLLLHRSLYFSTLFPTPQDTSITDFTVEPGRFEKSCSLVIKVYQLFKFSLDFLWESLYISIT